MKRSTFLFSVFSAVVLFYVSAWGQATITWTGGTSTDWSTASNWSPAQVPTNADSVKIATATYAPILTADASCRALTMSSGTLSLSSFTLTITTTGATAASGKLTMSGGTLNLNSGTLRVATMSGTSTIFNAGTSTVECIEAAPSASIRGTTYNNLNVNRSSSSAVSFGSSATINGNFTITAGEVSAGGATNTITGTAGGILTVASGAALRVLSTANDGFVTQYPGWGTVTLNGTVKYTSTSAQSISSSVTYANLDLTPSSSTTTGVSKTAVGALTVNGTFTCNNNGSGVINFADGGFTHSIKGNPTIGGGYSGAGTLNLNGTTGFQSVSLTPAINSLTIGNSNGITLSTTVTVIGTLTLTSGKLTLGSNNLTVATISGGSSSSYVVASSTGQLRQTVSATGSFTLPIGDATNYTPASINVTAGTFSSAYVGATVAASKHGSNTSTTDYINRYWTITTSGITSQSYDATCTYVTGDVAGTESNLYGGSRNGSAWTIQSAVNTGAHTLSATGITTTSTDFTAGEASALPVTLTSMTVKGGRASAEIRWSTATEVNSSSFEIERQLVGSNQWLSVGNVKAAGTSNSPKEYSFVDHSVVPGRYDYRLMEIDADGSSKYFGDTEVEVGQAAKVLTLGDNYPNPFNPATKIEFTLPENGHALLKVFNVIGQEVATLFNGDADAGRIYQTEFDAARLASGLYFYSLEYGNRKLVKKMLLLK